MGSPNIAPGKHFNRKGFANTLATTTTHPHQHFDAMGLTIIFGYCND
jgi:hypothetical protein